MSDTRHLVLLKRAQERLNTDNLDFIRVLPDVPFDPTLNGQKGLLVPGYYVSHPIYRGHIDGTVTLPSGDNWVTREVATLKHAYGYTPVQNMLSTYTRASVFVGASTLNWYLAEDTNRQGM